MSDWLQECPLPLSSSTRNGSCLPPYNYKLMYTTWQVRISVVGARVCGCMWFFGSSQLNDLQTRVSIRNQLSPSIAAACALWPFLRSFWKTETPLKESFFPMKIQFNLCFCPCQLNGYRLTSTVCPSAIPNCRPDATPFNLIKYEFFTCIGNSSLFNGHFSFQNFHWTQSPTASHLAHAVNGHRAWLWRILWGPETQLNSRIRRKGLPRIIFSTDNNFPLLRANADLEYYYSSR